MLRGCQHASAPPHGASLVPMLLSSSSPPPLCQRPVPPFRRPAPRRPSDGLRAQTKRTELSAEPAAAALLPSPFHSMSKDHVSHQCTLVCSQIPNSQQHTSPCSRMQGQLGTRMSSIVFSGSLKGHNFSLGQEIDEGMAWRASAIHTKRRGHHNSRRPRICADRASGAGHDINGERESNG